jgi:iron complex outermembrane receptor protein
MATKRYMAAAVVALCSRGAAAQPGPPVEADGEVIYVDGARPRAGVDDLDGARAEHADAARALDEPGFVTVVRVDERAGEQVTVAEVLAESVGVHARTLGGLGSFASISVRGAAPGQTAVFVDGVPLSRVAAAAVDIGAFELDGFSTIEVHRGAVPVALGGAALGGAVNFVTAVGPDADGHTLGLSSGVGSFGARHLRARWRDALLGGALGVHVSAGYRGAAGDYAYFDDNGTNLNLDDDRVADRTNNGFDQGDAVARARWRSGAWSFESGSRTLIKDQGLPGRGAAQTETASLRTASELVDARAVRDGERTRLTGTAFLLLEQQRFTDLAGEVGIGVEDQRHRTLSGGAAAEVVHALGARQRVGAGVEARADAFGTRDFVDPAMPTARGRRVAGAASAFDEIALGGDRVVIVPAIRVDVMRTDPGDGWDPILVDPDALGVRDDVFASPRLGARARLADGLVAKASAGRYFRAPTLLELFGDRGFLVGDPTLRPETGRSADAGLVFAPAGRWRAADRAYLEAAVFASAPRDAIAFQPSAGRVAVARNLGDADLRGAEAVASVRLWRRATLTANYTLVDSRQDSPMPSFDGKRLPLRPRHEAYARLDVAERIAGRLAVVWSELTHASGNFLDAANMNEVPARRLFGAGVKVQAAGGLLVAVEARNLTDERVETVALDPPPRPDLADVPRAVSDVLGYPLPGRSYYLTVDWSFR